MPRWGKSSRPGPRILRAHLVAAVAALALASSARGDDDNFDRLSPPTKKVRNVSHSSESGSARGKRSSTGWTTTAGALLFVVGLVVVTAKVLRKSLPASAGALPADALELLGRRPLDARHTLHIVRCGTRLLILGASPDGVRTLSEISDPDEAAALAEACRSAEPAGFATGIGRLFERLRPAADLDPAAPLTQVQADPRGLDDSAATDPAALRLRRHLESQRGLPTVSTSDAAEVAA